MSAAERDAAEELRYQLRLCPAHEITEYRAEIPLADGPRCWHILPVRTITDALDLLDEQLAAARARPAVTPESYHAVVRRLGVAEGEPSWYALPVEVRDALRALRLLAGGAPAEVDRAG